MEVETGLPAEPPSEPEQGTIAPPTTAPTFETDALNFYRFLIEDSDIPEPIKQNWFGFLTKEATLSKFDNSDIRRLLNMFDDSVDAYLMSKPAWKYGFDEEHIITQARARLFLKIKRAMEGFERRMLATQIIANIQQTENEKQAGGGIFGALRRMFGR